MFNVKGWIDVHHPCDGHYKAQLRVSLPVEYHQLETMTEIVRTVFEALDIPADETFQALFFQTLDPAQFFFQDIDRNGESDGGTWGCLEEARDP